MTSFIITKDLLEPGLDGAVDVIGPKGTTARDVARLKAGEGIEFRLLDDDHEVYFEGRRLGESDADHWYEAETELAPLDCFGAPDAGCTIQQERNAAGEWEAIN
jgi:hypothetical protein